MKRLIYILSVSFFSSTGHTQLRQPIHAGYESSAMVNQAKDALLSYSFIQKKGKQLGWRLQNTLLGSYAEELAPLAPLVTGKIELQAHDFKIYYDAKRSKSGVKYSLGF